MSSGFSFAQQYVQTTLPKLDEFCWMLKAHIPVPAETPGMPAAVVVALGVVVSFVREVAGEVCELVPVCVAEMEFLVLILPNSLGTLHDGLLKAEMKSAGETYERKEASKKVEKQREPTSAKDNRQRICEFIDAPDLQIYIMRTG